jgi:hypothetical protein
MGQLILFYIPVGFKRSGKWIPPSMAGRVIEFRALDQKKPA